MKIPEKISALQAKRKLLRQLDASLLAHAVTLCRGPSVEQVYRLQGLAETHFLVQNQYRFTPEDVAGLLAIKRGSGKKRRTAGLEDEIIAEIERNNYHTRQQIADMIQEKFHVKVSVATVGRLLKKRDQKTEKRFPSSESRHRKTACILRQRAETADG